MSCPVRMPAALGAGQPSRKSATTAPLVPLRILRSRTLVGQAAVLRVGFRLVAAIGTALMGAGSLLSRRSPLAAATSETSSSGCSSSVPASASPCDRHGRGARCASPSTSPGSSRASATPRPRSAERSGSPSSRHSVSRSDDYLAANDGTNPLVVLNEGFQSAFLALVVPAGIGIALGLCSRAQVHRVVDPRDSRLEQVDGTQGRRGRRGLEAEAAARRGKSSSLPASSSCARLWSTTWSTSCG